MEFSKIITIDKEGYQTLRYWNAIFAEFIREYPLNYSKDICCRFTLKNGAVYIHDYYGNIIEDFFMTVDDIEKLVDYIDTARYMYPYTDCRSIPWYKIGLEANRRLHDEKKKILDKQLKDYHDQQIRKLESLKITFPSLPENLHCTKSGKQWLSEAKNSAAPFALFPDIWFNKEICLLFADANIGKSVLAAQIAFDIAKYEKVIYFDYEMSTELFKSRFGAKIDEDAAAAANFIRSEPNQDVFVCENVENIILADIAEIISQQEAKIIIIDNITYINANINSNLKASRFMHQLKKLVVNNGLSMLILAHSAKRNLCKPITQNDLAGSKALFNFADSVFAIAQSTADSDIQYLKQLKCRCAKIKYGSDNVMLLRRVFTDNYLHFVKAGFDSESNLLISPRANRMQSLKSYILEMEAAGLPQVKIAEILQISQSKVSRIKNS